MNMDNSNPKFIRLNMNPYGRKIGDCVIRAISAGTLYGYKTLCKMFGNSFFRSLGSEDGVQLSKIDEFAFKYKLFKEKDLNIDPSWMLTARDMEDFRKFTGFNLKFWIRNLHESGITSRMIFLTKLNPTDDILPNSTRFHCVYSNIGLNAYYDLSDSGNTIVFNAYEIDSSKRAKSSDKFYYKNEMKALKDEDAEYKKSLLKK